MIKRRITRIGWPKIWLRNHQHVDDLLWYQAVWPVRVFDLAVSPLVKDHGLPVQASLQWTRNRLQRRKRCKEVEKEYCGNNGCGLRLDGANDLPAGH